MINKITFEIAIGCLFVSQSEYSRDNVKETEKKSENVYLGLALWHPKNDRKLNDQL